MGTVPKMAGKTSGMTYPLFKYSIIRVRISQNSPMFKILHDAGYPHEPDFYAMQTEVFEFPVLQGPAKVAEKASIWEQATLLIMLQREWADNAVSNTLNFKSKEFYPDNHEEDDIESVLSAMAPLTKSVALLPHSTKGVYKQMPQEGITKEEYEERIKSVKKIDWSLLTNSQPDFEKYCDSGKCEVIQ